MSALGSIGARLDLNVRAGDTLGPFVATLTDPATGAPIVLTGFTWEGAVSRIDTEDGNQALTITVLDAIAGKVQFKLDKTATVALADADSDFFRPTGTYNWFLKGTDTLGSKQTYLYGVVNVAKENPT